MGDINIDTENTALLFTDPQVDALKPEGVMWDKVGDTVKENNVVEKLANLRDAAHEGDVPVFYSPHYYNDDEYDTL